MNKQKIMELVDMYADYRKDEHRAAIEAALPDVPTVPDEFAATNGDVLWLWKNGDTFLAFKHLYPCYEPGGDPMTLGEPFGKAVFRASHDRATLLSAAPEPAQVSDKSSEAEQPKNEWRALALKFDGQRMAALSHLRLLLDHPEDHAEAARTFLSEPPSAAQAEQPKAGEVAITTNQAGQCVAVTRQDDEGQILSVLWEPAQAEQPRNEPVKNEQWPTVADPFTYIIQHLNSNPYNLTKQECVDLIRELRSLYTSPQAQPMSDEQREMVFAAASKRLDESPNLAWRVAILEEVERFHKIGLPTIGG